MKELLAIYDDRLRPLGSLPREEVHRRGLLHQVVHCWVVSPDGGKLYFQQRALTKKDFPGLYDIAVGGHVDAGEGRMNALLREMGEELGLCPRPEQLRYLGVCRQDLLLDGFLDREAAQVFLCLAEAPAFAPGEEVDRVVWAAREDFRRKEELGAAVPLHTLTGELIQAPADRWCLHREEFLRLGEPALRGLAAASGENRL